MRAGYRFASLRDSPDVFRAVCKKRRYTGCAHAREDKKGQRCGEPVYSVWLVPLKKHGPSSLVPICREHDSVMERAFGETGGETRGGT